MDTLSPSNRGQLIDTSKLEVGDVVLTNGGAPNSRGIAWGTGGAYSHAAMMLTPTLCVESVTKPGVTLERVPVVGYEVDGAPVFGQEFGGLVTVLRPDWPEELHDEDARIAALCGEVAWRVGRHYSAFERLLAVPDLRPDLRGPLPRAVAQCLDDERGVDGWSSFERGPFCSELVDLLLSAANGVPAGESLISPNGLFAQSRFSVVPDAVIDVSRAERLETAELGPFLDAVDRGLAAYRRDTAQTTGRMFDLIKDFTAKHDLSRNPQARKQVADLLRQGLTRLLTVNVRAIRQARRAELDLLDAVTTAHVLLVAAPGSRR